MTTIIAILVTLALIAMLGIGIAIRTAVAYDAENDESQDNG